MLVMVQVVGYAGGALCGLRRHCFADEVRCVACFGCNKHHKSLKNQKMARWVHDRALSGAATHDSLGSAGSDFGET